MPYKLSADERAVMVQRESKTGTKYWRTYKRYFGSDAKKRAQALLTALSINVRHT